jgi:copper oxidase (laccase) domain-containing protein
VTCPGICTIENLDLFYSHRAEAGVTGRFASLVMLR